MRNALMTLAVAALAVTGCKALNLTEDTGHDWSKETTKAPVYLDLEAPHKVVCQKFDATLTGKEPKVVLVLKNEGVPEDLFSVDVEFAYPAPAGSFAPYDPQFVSVDLVDFGTGAVSKELVVTPPQGVTGTPYFARIKTTKGSEVRMTASREESKNGTRPGTRLLQGRVEVVSFAGDLTLDKPTLSFTLENVDTKPVGEVKYTVQFFKNGKQVDLGKRVAGFKKIEKPLGGKGDKVSVDVTYTPGELVSLAGARPVLRLSQQ